MSPENYVVFKEVIYLSFLVHVSGSTAISYSWSINLL